MTLRLIIAAAACLTLAVLLRFAAVAQAQGQTSAIDSVTDFYFTQGVLGVTCVGLLFIIWRLWIRLNERDAKIEKIYEERIAEGKAALSMMTELKATQAALLDAIRKGTP